MMDNLLPCPFCGAEIHEANMEAVDFGEPKWVMIVCPRCATASGASANKKLVIERWNTRPTPPHSDIDGIREALATLNEQAPFGDLRGWKAKRDLAKEKIVEMAPALLSEIEHHRAQSGEGAGK